MTAMQLVVDSRDSEEIWLARAAPRRWYAEGFGVRNGPTRYGNVTYALDAMADSKIRLSLSAGFTQLPHVQHSLDVRNEIQRAFLPPGAADDAPLGTSSIDPRARTARPRERVAAVASTPS